MRKNSKALKGTKKRAPIEVVARADLANHELVVVAALLADAHILSADTEDIAVQANALAPGRFSWRKYKDQINIDTVRKRLWDATKPEKGGYLIGSEKSGWRLTKVGYDFAQRHVESRRILRGRVDRVSQNERATTNREVRRMTNETAFIKYEAGQLAAITRLDAERFFRLDDYVTGKARVAKIERLRIIAGSNERLSKAIGHLKKIVIGD